MEKLKFILAFLILPFILLGQKKTFEIFGNISGEYKDKIYFFYENDFSHKDSLSSIIKNGKFYFKATADLPKLCRFHFGENTNVQELYIDNIKTVVNISTKLTEKNTPDSLGGARTHFELTSINGSKTEDRIRSFQIWENQLEKSNFSVGQKNSEYYTKLKSLIELYPANKGSAYLLGKAHTLRYIEIYELSSLLSKSVINTFEWNTVLKNLNSLNKEQNRRIGSSFNDVILKDTNENKIDTKKFRGKYVLVDLWASWCLPCRSLNTQLKFLYNHYKEKGFEIISISLDEDKKAWKEAIINDALKWTLLNDEKGFSGELTNYYDIGAVPAQFLLDKDGKVIGFNLPFFELEAILKKSL